MAPRPTHRTLVGLAWLNVALHLAGLELAAVNISPGTQLVPLGEQLGYLASEPIGWTVGWAVWMSCALALIAFLAAVTWRLGRRARLANLGLTIAVVGAAFDLFCDSIYILVFPGLPSARQFPEERLLFLIVERVTGIGSVVIANGAYSIGILLLTVAMAKQPWMPRIATGMGFAVAGFGLLLAATGFTGVAWHTEVAAAQTIGLFCLWVVLVAQALNSAGRQP